jgi:hypothetical protein
VRVIPSQEEALQAVLAMAGAGDLVVVESFYSDWAWERITRFRSAAAVD